MVKEENFILYNGVAIPKIGFGTWQVKDGEEAYNSTLFALKAGYKHIDTAFAYRNEESVGRAIKDSKIDRKSIFVTSKLPADIKNYDDARACFLKSLKNLGLDYLDLYLIHAPWPWTEIGKDCREGNIEAWRALIDLYKEGKIRSIGVSNFHVDDLKNIIDATGVKPMVNQIRFFIGNTQEKITSYCQENDILVEAYSPLATGAIVENEELKEIASKYNVSIPQLCIRYCLERNTLPLPKSIHEERIRANLNVNFKISSDDMKILNNLDGIGPKKELRSWFSSILYILSSLLLIYY